MKTSATVFVLLALLSCTGLMAQTAAPATTKALSTAEFLATLSGAPSAPSSDLAPGPLFLATSTCSSSADCPANQLCCPACGQPDCGTRCTKPLNGSCPRYP